MNFKTFKTAVATQFAAMTHGAPELYCANVSGDELWDLYLGSFPEGSDPVYRERRGHDCSCCKQFIRNVGNVVAIQNGELVSMWGGATGDYGRTVGDSRRQGWRLVRKNRWFFLQTMRRFLRRSWRFDDA
jgi:hypothetical protein